ncbi:hypothetical protein MRX96_035605 [Rhipicephalus microplus]
MGLSVATRVLLFVSLLFARSATNGNAAADEAGAPADGPATEPYSTKQLDAPAERAVTAGLQFLADDAGPPPPTDGTGLLTAVEENPQNEEPADGQNKGVQDTAQGDMAVAEDRSDRSYAAVRNAPPHHQQKPTTRTSLRHLSQCRSRLTST